MNFIIEKLSSHLSKVQTSEIEPGYIIMIAIWLLSSFFSKKKKGMNNSLNKEKKASSFESIMKKLGERPNMETSQAQEIYPEPEEDFFEEEFNQPELQFQEVEEVEIIQEVEEVEIIQEEVKVEFLPKKKKHKNGKLFGTPLQKAMVLKEILDKPRAMRPFIFSGSNDT